ncbi:MAG: DEDD exonuclease domain-containing protein, partial [Actinomycetes bacterium]
GPFSSKEAAERSVAALHEAFPVRQCGGRMPKTPSLSACVLAEMGKCLSPCNGSVDPAEYHGVVENLRSTLRSAPDAVIGAVSRRMTALAASERFEDATTFRDRLAAFIRGASRTQRLSSLTRCAELVAARREDDGRWAVHVVRHGRLAAAGVIPPGAHAGQSVQTLCASAESVAPGPGPTPAATAEETEKILRWLESDGVRLVRVEGDWTCPIGGATKHLRIQDAVNTSRANLVPFDDRRPLNPVHQPVR